jgi:hypothetical protein
MPNPVFPTLPSGTKLTSEGFSIEREDPSMQTELEGGYVFSRRKHTRTPRSSYNCMVRELTEADRLAMDSFWDTVGGGSVIFDWTHPTTLAVVAVRFKGPITYTYTGWGPLQRWDCSFVLQQA